MRRYETIFIVRPNVTEDQIEAITNKSASIIEGDGGTIIRVDNWGLKKLAYLIKKESQGYYVYVDYAGVPVSVAEIERIFRIDDRILKYLTVKLADSCDPVAIKEQIAKDEAVPASDEDESVTAKDEPVTATSDKDESVTAKDEPVTATSDKDESVTASDKDEPVTAASDKEVKEEDKADTVKEEQVD